MNILYVDLGKVTDQNVLRANAELSIDLLKKNPLREPTVLISIEGAYLSTEFLKWAKVEIKELLEEKPCKTAMIGISGLKRIIFNGYVRFTGSKAKAFATQEQAEAYLTGRSQIITNQTEVPEQLTVPMW